MKKDYILFIDSGVGGLSTLAETYKILPGNFIYFADTKNAPYGSHTKAEIIEFVRSIIKRTIQKFDVKVVVLACNTATTAAAKTLRSEFKKIKIVGTEPAIKLATDQGFKKILCLSTPATAKQKKFQRLKKQLLEKNVQIVSHGLFDFAKNIDDYFLSDSISANFSLLKNLYRIKQLSKNFDCIVLGCTHYCLLSNKIFTLTNKPVLCGNAGVAQRVFVVQKNICKINTNSKKKASIKFVFSNNLPGFKQKYIKIFEQILANCSNVC